MFKRSLFTLALLGPFGLAHAQSSVTIYGIVDLSASVVHTGSGVANRKVVDSGVGYGSRLGFKGTEDLGGGLSANFLMEMGLAADNGTLQQGGLAFGRQIFVGLASPNWSVTAGRQYSPLWSSIVFADTFGQTYWGNTSSTLVQSVFPRAVAGDGGHSALARVNNSVIVSGFAGAWTGRFMAAAGDENDSGSGRIANASITYAAGPFGATASIARFRQDVKDIPTGAAPAWQNAWTLGGRWDFGVAKVFGGYYAYDPSETNVTVTDTTFVKTNAVWIGAQIPFGASRVFAQVTSSRFDHAGGVAQGRATTFGATYEYALSKRTYLYTAYGQVSNNATSSLSLFGATTVVSPSAAGEDPKALSVGMRHMF